jgi:hypothetical protein
VGFADGGVYMPTVISKEIDLRIDIKRGRGIERIQVFADSNLQREAGLRALLSISQELDEIERKMVGREPGTLEHIFAAYSRTATEGRNGR